MKSTDTISKWLTQRDPTNHINYIPLMIKIYNIRPMWLFLGKKFPKFGDTTTRKFYYSVIKTEIIEKGDWIIILDDYKIVTAENSIIADTRVQIETRKINEKPHGVITRYIPIARCLTRDAAVKALKKESQRIKREGVDVWKAPWSAVEIR